MPNKHLNVWLHGIRVARLSEPSRYRLRMDFTTDALDTFGEGSRVLSLSLPISPEPAVDGKGRPGSIVSAFIEGLLPEGNLRQHLAREGASWGMSPRRARPLRKRRWNACTNRSTRSHCHPAPSTSRQG